MHLGSVVARREMPFEGGCFAECGYVLVIDQKQKNQIVPSPSLKGTGRLRVKLESQFYLFSQGVPFTATSNEEDLVLVVDGKHCVNLLALQACRATTAEIKSFPALWYGEGWYVVCLHFCPCWLSNAVT